MSTFITGCPIEDLDTKDVPKPQKPARLRRPQSHRPGSVSKKTQIKEERAFQIFKENQILLQKMIHIDSKPSSLRNFRTLSAPYPSKSRSRSDQQQKILLENQRYIERLKNATSHYSISRFERDNKYRQYLKQKICKKKFVKPDIKTLKLNLDQELIEKILRRREHRIEKSLVNK